MATLKAASYLRNFTFGVEDSLSSTVGLLSGIASAQVANSTIIISGLILIFTEALSMGVGSFLSEESVEEFTHRKALPLSRTLPSAFVMFFSYLLAGLIPLAPYVFFAQPWSLWLSVALAVSGLGLLGVFNSRVSHTSVAHQVARMLILGGSVAIAGVIIGQLLRSLT